MYKILVFATIMGALNEKLFTFCKSQVTCRNLCVIIGICALYYRNWCYCAGFTELCSHAFAHPVRSSDHCMGRTLPAACDETMKV